MLLNIVNLNSSLDTADISLSFSAYLLLPLGCILISIFVSKVWGWKNYEKELTADGRDGTLSKWTKFCITVLAPVFMIIVLLNVFGFIK